MAIPRPLLVAGVLAGAGIVGVLVGVVLWPREQNLVAKAIARARMDGFDVAFQQCKAQQTVDDVQRCVAAELYPDASWPPPDNAPEWQREAWRLLRQRVRTSLGLSPPTPTITALKL